MKGLTLSCFRVLPACYVDYVQYDVFVVSIDGKHLVTSNKFTSSLFSLAIMFLRKNVSLFEC